MVAIQVVDTLGLLQVVHSVDILPRVGERWEYTVGPMETLCGVVVDIVHKVTEEKDLQKVSTIRMTIKLGSSSEKALLDRFSSEEIEDA